jgi:hypothetical protein
MKFVALQFIWMCIISLFISTPIRSRVVNANEIEKLNDVSTKLTSCVTVDISYGG